MLPFLAAYLGAGAALAVLDALWLTQVGPRLYRPTLDPVLADKPNMTAALAFYLVYVLGVVLLAVWPNRDAGLVKTAVTGAMLGALAYATYDLTNQATLKVWSTRITLIDIGWGAFLTASGAAAGWLAWRWAYRMF
ncbi:conserved hypothetical protein [Phenylobacterium zucineum HLK1]|uniref:DUF2177 domain-containing protein n=1 Tax=Phenylobacterium zucineum (strain HLK1) TaxID=450851 RepID=B4R9L0_PHEZH|nr:DUF2177 family protein [Phenylobacterium zucineum]ACG79470.1 conserved hypothetical protein [Phenylobacterium zucineum HLK1]